MIHKYYKWRITIQSFEINTLKNVQVILFQREKMKILDAA